MELIEYWNLVRRWAWLLALGLIIGTGSAYYASSRQTPVYQASTKVLVLQGPQILPVQQDTVVDLSNLSGRELLATYIELLSTRPILELAGERLGMPVSAGQLNAQQVGGTNIIRLTVQDSDPDNAAVVANTLVEILVEQNEQLQASRFETTEQSLQAQLEQVQAQIDSVQAEIQQLNEVELETAQSVESLAARVADAEARLAELVGIAETANRQILALEIHLSEFRQLQAEAAGEDIANFSVAEVLALQDEIQSLSRVLSLREQTSQATASEAVADPRRSQLENSLTIYQRMYTDLLGNYESVRLARERNTPSVVHIEAAIPAQEPVEPQPLRDAGLGAAVGLIIAGGLAVLLEYLDDTVKSPVDVKRVLGLPVLGAIARIENEKGAETEVHVLTQPKSAVSEAFRMLRANIDLVSREKELKTILVVSDSPRVGKTTLAVNLAAVLAQDGKQVVLLDADLRRPAIHNFLGISNRIGLFDLIKGNVSVNESIHLWRNLDGLKVIASGRLPPNPTETLNARTMTKILAELDDQADVVIIDSPPYFVAESMMLASLVDGVIWVLEPGQTRVATARSVVEQLERSGTWVAGVVLNRVSPKYGRYYTGYYQEYDRFEARSALERGNGRRDPQTGLTRDGRSGQRGVRDILLGRRRGSGRR